MKADCGRVYGSDDGSMDGVMIITVCASVFLAF